MADILAAEVLGKAESNSVPFPGAPTGSVTPLQPVEEFFSAAEENPAISVSQLVYNLLTILHAAAQAYNADDPDPQLLQTYAAPTVAFNQTTGVINITITSRFREDADLGNNVTTLSLI